MKISEYLDRHSLTLEQFATLLGVHRRAVDFWLARERYFHNGQTGVKGTGLLPKRAKEIERRTNGEIQASYLFELSSI